MASAAAPVLLLLLAACGDNRKLAKDAAPTEGAPATCTPVSGSTISLRAIGKINGLAVLATAPPDDPRLFVVERESRIWIFRDEELLPEPFLDLTGVVNTEATVERGLLGLAFHPRYVENGQFYVFYTTDLYSTVARCSVSADTPDRANPACTVILEVDHANGGNHNAGMIEFGNDGYLYISTGDGGGAGDPLKRAQNPANLLGKILRIDVDTRAPGLEYGIPPGNPFATGGGRPEVFMRGLRNGWRFSFDRATGDIWIGDVGQNRTEEMNVLRPAQQPGANLGWSIYEGNACCMTQDDSCLEQTTLPCDPAGMFFPQDARDRATPRGALWRSIVAGQTYRGTCYPDLVGWHFYTDFYQPVLVKARLLADDTLELHEDNDFLDGISSIHADARGELFATHFMGMVYHLEAEPP